MKMNYNEFAEKVKLKDSRFKDMDNISVAKQVIKENPYYADKVDFDDNFGKTLEGTGRAVGNIATFGQGSHLAGVGEGVGSMFYNVAQPIKKSIYNLSQFKNPLKPLKEIKNAFDDDYTTEYKEGREEFKKDQKKFEELHPVLNTIGETTGALATIPVGGAVAKVPTIAKLLKGAGAVKKGALAGASWGASEGFGHGLSNTEGEGADIEKALTNAGIGGVAGGTIGTALPLAFMGLKGGINTIAKIPSKLKTGYKGDTIQYTVPNGVQTKAYKKLAENPEIQKEALRGDIGMRSQEFQDKAAEKTIGFVPELFEKVSKDYESLPKDIFISFDEKNTGSKLLKTIDNFRFDTKFMPNKKVEKEARTLINDILKVTKKENNENGITRENLQRAMNTAWEKSQKAFKNGDNAVGKLYNDIYNALREARATNKAVEKASSRYHDIQQVKERLENALQVKFKKGANHRQVATKLIQEGRNRVGTQFDEALNFANDTLSKYTDMPNVKELKTAIDLAQVSYDFRPPEADKLLNKVPSQKGIMNKIFNMAFDFSPQEKAKLLAKNLKEGTITKEDILGKFDVINAGKFSTGLNRFLQSQKVFGSKINPIAALMRRKSQNTPLPTFLLTDGKRFSDIVRNPLILETNRRKDILENVIRSK